MIYSVLATLNEVELLFDSQILVLWRLHDA